MNRFIPITQKALVAIFIMVLLAFAAPVEAELPEIATVFTDPAEWRAMKKHARCEATFAYMSWEYSKYGKAGNILFNWPQKERDMRALWRWSEWLHEHNVAMSFEEIKAMLVSGEVGLSDVHKMGSKCDDWMRKLQYRIHAEGAAR